MTLMPTNPGPHVYHAWTYTHACTCTHAHMHMQADHRLSRAEWRAALPRLLAAGRSWAAPYAGAALQVHTYTCPCIRIDCTHMYYIHMLHTHVLHTHAHAYAPEGPRPTLGRPSGAPHSRYIHIHIFCERQISFVRKIIEYLIHSC